ncbi:MAG: glycosyltransferase family 2 protein [Muribaculaceae bacterium]|nr:glycosyltransferase family 2 protein [Muribaculaceae bacterium]
MSHPKRFSVFTATYNRASVLPRLYEELKSQTFKDFEWIIVNDGSSDNTDEVVNSFIQEDVISIKYIAKSNGGKHTAWRAAMPYFSGRYVLTADDDDPVTPDMLEVFDRHWSILENQPDYDDFWEIRTRCKRPDGTLVGKELPSPWYDSNYNDICFKQKASCEMVGCRKNEIVNSIAAVPEVFPYMEHASNFAEGIRWSRAARKYKTRFVPEITRIYIESTGGLCDGALSRCMAGDKRMIYNKLVEFYFTLLERSDLLLRYDKKAYLKNIAGYALLLSLEHPEDRPKLRLREQILVAIARPFMKAAIWFNKKV